MSELPPSSAAGDEPPERKPLFDPYTGERLAPPAGENSARPIVQENAAPRPSAGPLRQPPRKVLWTLLVVLVLVLGGAAAWYITGPRADAQTKEHAKERRLVAAKAEKQRAAACEALLEDPYGQLESINSRLDVGMREEDYSNAVGLAKASLDSVDQAKVESHSCGSYQTLQEAVDQYSQASSYWNSCIIDDYCTPDDSKLNTYWSKAKASLDTVKSRGLGARSGSTS